MSIQSGFSRRELFIDARDLQRDSDPDKPMTAEEYAEALRNRGQEKLAEHKIVQSFNVTVRATDATYNYKTDYFLGDTVTVLDRRLGITVDAIVEGIRTHIDGNGEGLELILGFSQATLADLLRRKVDK